MGKKRRPQGKPQEMSLEEFNKKANTGVTTNPARVADESAWLGIDISQKKDPDEQAKLFKKVLVDPAQQKPATDTTNQAAASDVANAHSQLINANKQFADFASVSETTAVLEKKQNKSHANTKLTTNKSEAQKVNQEEEKQAPASVAPRKPAPKDDEWNQVKTKQEEKEAKREAAIYKVPPNRPNAGKQKNTPVQSQNSK